MATILEVFLLIVMIFETISGGCLVVFGRLLFEVVVRFGLD